MSTAGQHLIEMAQADAIADRLHREAFSAADAAGAHEQTAYAIGWMEHHAADRIVRAEAKGRADLRDQLWMLTRVYGPGVTVVRALEFLEDAARTRDAAGPAPPP